ncbi:MAG: sensor histidine kinase [Vicinamibacterales bacterium]
MTRHHQAAVPGTPPASSFARPGTTSGPDPSALTHIAAVAHDMRNPLGVIEFSAVRLLQDRDVDRAALEHALRVVLRSVAQVRQLTDALLDVSADGRVLVQPGWVCTRDLLADVAALGTPLAERARLSLSVHDGEGLPAVWADPLRLCEVFQNLVGNAAKFTQAGGHVAVHAELVGGEVHFSVADDGPGIAPEDQVRIFSSYWRKEPPDERGHGLGLSICRQIIEAHGGRIWVRSEPGDGAQFTFTLRTATAPR